MSSLFTAAKRKAREGAASLKQGAVSISEGFHNLQIKTTPATAHSAEQSSAQHGPLSGATSAAASYAAGLFQPLVEGHCIIEVVCGTDVPRPGVLERGSHGAYVQLCIMSDEGEMRGSLCKTAARLGTDSPRWHCIRDLRWQGAAGDTVVFHVLDGASARVYTAQVALAKLQPGVAMTLPLYLNLQPCSPKPAFLTVLRRPTQPFYAKRIFFIRHGESKWNEAQASSNLVNMLGFDHPLNRTGVDQAARLHDEWKSRAGVREREGESLAMESPVVDLGGVEEAPGTADLLGLGTPAQAAPSGALEELMFDAAIAKEEHPMRSPSQSPWASKDGERRAHYASDAQVMASWLGAGLVAVSPLTRALQTAIVALQEHPCVRERGLKLLRSAREIKGPGGLDTVGKAVGEEIYNRVKENLEKVVGEEQSSELMDGCTIDVNDAVSDWWTHMDDMDTEGDLEDRYHDFNCSLIFDPSDTIIVVGHSLFFQGYFRRFLGGEFASKHPDIANQLQNMKMGNASCVMLDIEYSAEYEIKIVSAKPVFGAYFK